ncbi:MAG: serine/threonine protein kinase [Planctomycetes bacterium]|nr:serine/threonine protein kinase [Planctomycetota bacterium]
MQFPGYELLDAKPIGSGARGKVYRAKDTATDEIVAIKVFSGDSIFDDSMRQEVAKLIKAHSSVSGFISIKKTAFDADPPYYVMPFCKDGSLHKRIELGKLPVKEAVAIFTPIVRAMASVHQKGLIHGDLKPANILFNESGEPLITDFGLAQFGTTKSDAYGTLYFMPPEQARPEDFRADLRWDVYALGATLYQMLTQELPRRNQRLENLLSHSATNRGRADVYRDEIQKAALVPLREKARNVDKHLSRIVDDCLAIDPEKRPRDAGDLLFRLGRRERWLNNRPFLTMMAGFTALVLILAAVAVIMFSRDIIAQATLQVEEDMKYSLRDRAWIGRQLIREKIDDRVRIVESIAAMVPGKDGLRPEFEKIADNYSKRPPDEFFRPFTEEELNLLKPVAEWLEQKHESIVQQRISKEETKRMGLYIIVQGKSYLIGITGPDNKALNPNALPLIFQTNWSWRDYYGGTGNLFNEKRDRHWPKGRTHVSQAYVSRGDERLKIDISTPIRFDNRGAADIMLGHGRQASDRFGNDVIGMLVISIDVKQDLTDWFDPDQSSSVNSKGEIVIVNDRGSVVFHPGVKDSLLNNKDPEPLYKDLDWFKNGKATNIVYDDPSLKDLADQACLAYCQPVEFLEKSISGKPWWVIAQVHQKAAEKPIEDLRTKLRLVGVIGFVVVISLVAVLWYALIRILSRQTRDAHV